MVFETCVVVLWSLIRWGRACGRKIRELNMVIRVALVVGYRRQIGRKSSVYPGGIKWRGCKLRGFSEKQDQGHWVQGSGKAEC